MNHTNKELIQKAVDNLRVFAAAMPEQAKSGHPGGAMGGADFIHVLYSEFLNWDPDDMTWAHRDRFFLDPGHMSPMLYGILALTKNLSMDDIKNFRQWDSPTPGHPELDASRGIENTSGPLGQGHAMALGAAIAEKFLSRKFGDWLSHYTYAYISDGGIQEEISQGVGRLAGYWGLGKFIMFYDANDIQLSTPTKAVTEEDTAKKYEAWGWQVLRVNGNDCDQIRAALKQAQEDENKPTLIIGQCVMGKGAVDADNNPFEGKVSIHGQPLSGAGASFEKTIEKHGGDPNHPFKIFPEVDQYYNQILEEKKATARKKKEEEKAWAAKNPDLAKQLKDFFTGEARNIDFEKIEYKDDIATRAASGVALGYFAEHIENMFVASADLSNSDKTDGFLKKNAQFAKDNPDGRFLNIGVSELTMAGIMNGMALHGGVIPACGTFFVFSDFMKPAVRLAALMELPVKYVWTHDAFRVGEDGPTHQPIEQEAQIRLLEKLHNHSGEPGMLVMRPADAAETIVAWKLALENTKTPSALLLSRQGIKSLPAKKGSTRYIDALESAKGAYIVKDTDGTPDVVLIANGSEVSTCYDGAQLLADKGIKARVVSAISEGLFRQQPKQYQQEIIPDDIPRFGMTAGLPDTLKGLVGDQGKVWGMTHFGYSAPYKILDEKFGFTGENVLKQVLELLNK
jgi:transketolase